MTAANVGLLLLRWWWLVFNAVTLSLVLALVWVNQQPEYYESEASYALVVRVDDPSNIVRATTTLKSSDQIMETYIGVANSEAIDGRARQALAVVENDRANTSATSSLVSGTNVMLVSAQSADPQLAVEMAGTVGRLTEAYVAELGEVFLLSALDPPGPPIHNGPNTFAALAVGVIAALTVSVAVASALEYRFPSGPHHRRLRDIFDREVPVYSLRYLRMRLREEVLRSADTGQAFGVGVLQIVKRRPNESEDDRLAPLSLADLDVVASAVNSTLRKQDLLAHLGHGRFLAVLPGLDLYEAQDAVGEWRKEATAVLLEDDIDRDIIVKVGACEFSSMAFIGDRDAEQIVTSL